MSGSALASRPPHAGLEVLIRITAGPNKGEEFRIFPPGAIIGRDPLLCQIVLADARVSRQQFRLDYKMEGLTVEDISGKNSTLVNQQPISGEHLLANGDVLAIGDSQIAVQIQWPPMATPSSQMGKSTPPPLKFSSAPSPYLPPLDSSSSTPDSTKRVYYIVGIGLLAAMALWLVPETPPQPPPKIATQETLNESIEAVQKRQVELQKSTSTLSELDLYNKRSSQKHFVRGFRDFQNGKYNRALEAFQTALATDRNNTLARRYYKLSEKKRMDDVDFHMDLGIKYREKSMYRMCIAEFEQVLQILNQPQNKKYQLAKEQMKECRLSLQEGF